VSVRAAMVRMPSGVNRQFSVSWGLQPKDE
jgi:hypothetical protein